MKKILIFIAILFQIVFISNVFAENMTWQDYNEMGDTMHKAELYKDAIDYYTKAIGIRPNEDILYYNRGVSKYCLKDYNGAITDFKRAISLNPNDNVAKSFLNMAKESADKMPSSKQTNLSGQNYGKMQPVQQLSWQNYYNDGINYYNRKNYQAAVTSYTNAIRLNPNYVNSYINRGWTYFELKKYDESIEDFNSAIRINPQDADLYFNRGVVKNNKGDYYGAIADYSVVIQSDSKNWKSYLYRGDNYYRVKKYFSALNDFKSSLNIQNSDETISRINSLRQNFKNPVFLLENYKSILEELGYLQCLILLICVVIIFSNVTKVQPTFKEYDKNYISQRFHFERININTPIPQPEDFHIDRSRLDYLEKIYRQTDNTFSNDDESGVAVMWSIILSFYFSNFMNKILTMYFYNLNEDWFWIISIVIPAVIIYYTLKKLPAFFKSAPDITPHESNTYLLYKGAIELYNEKMEPIRAAEEERLRKIREEEERKLRQQRSYWEKYWAEKQKDGFQFEEAVGELYKKMGYKVTVTQGTGDGGVDLILKKNGEITIVQCKAHTHQVGPEPVRALWGVREDFKATTAIFVAYSGVTSGAIDFAKGKNMQLVNLEDLISMSIEVNTDKHKTKNIEKDVKRELHNDKTSIKNDSEIKDNGKRTKIDDINKSQTVEKKQDSENQKQILELYAKGIIDKDEFIKRMSKS